MQLSVQQTKDLLQLIEKNQIAIIGQELGDNFLTDYDKQLLRQWGINPNAIYQPELSSIQTSFHFGMLSEALGAMVAENITYPEIRQYVKEGRYIPVSYRQQVAMDSIKFNTFTSLKTLQGKIFSDVNNIIADKTYRGQMEFLAEELKDGINKSKTVSQIAHSIAEKTGDWGRNFDRIIETASQTAFETGKAAEIQRRNPGKDPDVYKIVQESACKHCVRLYTTSGIGSKPIIFKLSALIANGSNVGRKVDEWKATVDATHPYCRCALQSVPEGYIWNTDTKSFSTPDPEYKKKTMETRPLIPIKIGDNIFHV